MKSIAFVLPIILCIGGCTGVHIQPISQERAKSAHEAGSGASGYIVSMKWFLLVCFSILFYGCNGQSTWLYKDYSVAPLESIQNAQKLYKDIKNNLPEAAPCFFVKDESPSVSPITPKDCATRRNYVVSVLVAESVNLCSKHLNSIYGHEAAFNIATGSVAGLAAGLASVSGVSQAPYLSALSAFATSERGLVNETVYKNMVTTAIGTKIREMREEKGKLLLSRKKESFDTYGMEDAIQDVLDFHEACSFRRGLELALAEGTQTTLETKRQQLEAKAQALMLQIEAYAQAHRMVASDYGLDNRGSTSSINDPFLKGLVDQYLAVNQAMLSLTTIATTNTVNNPLPRQAPAATTFEGTVDTPATDEAKSMVVKGTSGEQESFTVTGDVLRQAKAFNKGDLVIVEYEEKNGKKTAISVNLKK